jgi:hypothetical protein
VDAGSLNVVDCSEWFWNDFEKGYHKLTSEQIIAVVQRSIARVSATDKLIVQMDNENIEFCERSRIESMFKSEFIRVLCVIS